ncbi:MAG: hypothetical protein NVSMB62_21500 [Acidobacteriaceae bacterium]
MNAGTNRKMRAVTERLAASPARLAPADRAHSRRTTVMRRYALTGAIREYQSDSSSKRPVLVRCLRLLDLDTED